MLVGFHAGCADLWCVRAVVWFVVVCVHAVLSWCWSGMFKSYSLVGGVLIAGFAVVVLVCDV